MAEPFVVVGAAIVHDGRVLATERAYPRSLAGLWEFPGGKVEPGETEVEALRRECAEELSLDIRVGARVGPDALILGGTAVLRLYLATTDSTDVVLHEHSAFRWLSADDVDAVPWIPEDAVLVDAVRLLLPPGR